VVWPVRIVKIVTSRDFIVGALIVGAALIAAYMYRRMTPEREEEEEVLGSKYWDILMM